MGLRSAFNGHNVDSSRFLSSECPQKGDIGVTASGKIQIARIHFYGRLSFLKGFAPVARIIAGPRAFFHWHTHPRACKTEQL
jgi:hypothetical protein